MTVIEMPTPDPRTFDDETRPFAEAISTKYAIKRQIGRGGMGVVYLARDRRLDRLVAIKTLPAHLAADQSVRERFFRETRTAGAMAHPNIVPIYGADELAGHVFSIMSYVDGDSLAAHIRAQGRLTPQVALGVLRDVAAALSHAHGRGVIHRDIKAENILIERGSGRALVTDFGIARLAEAAPLTATGQLLGTVYYVSPEQVAGEPIDARSDLYSLGVVGFFAVTGTFPFDAEMASAVLVAHVTKLAPPVRSINSDVPPALAQIIDRCLVKSRVKRYASADDLLAALNRVDANRLRVAPHQPTGPRLISDTEANALWGRAAELQASTEAQQRPSVLPAARDTTKDAARTSGFSLDSVREAGREAGLSTGFLARAMAEHGLTRGEQLHLPAQVQRALHHETFRLTPALQFIQEQMVDGEIEMQDFDRVMSLLRDGTGLEGRTTWFPPALLWKATSTGYELEATVVPSAGQTMVRLQLNLRRSEIAAFLVSAGLALATGIMAVSFASTRSMDGAGLMAVVTVVAPLVANHWLLKEIRKRAGGQLRVLTEAIVGTVRRSTGM